MEKGWLSGNGFGDCESLSLVVQKWPRSLGRRQSITCNERKRVFFGAFCSCVHDGRLKQTMQNGIV